MNKNVKNTILNQEMKPASTPSEACRNGLQYFLAAEAEAYKDFSKDHLASLLHSAGNMQIETGYIRIFEDPTMPMDARVDIIHKPTYVTAAIGIYAQNNYPEIFDAELSRMFHDLLEGAFEYGIIGHGIDHQETVRRTMLMLCKAGLREFLDAHSEEFPAFANAINRHIEHFTNLAKKIDEDGIIVTANGFSSDSINHLDNM